MLKIWYENGEEHEFTCLTKEKESEFSKVIKKANEGGFNIEMDLDGELVSVLKVESNDEEIVYMKEDAVMP